MQHLNQFVFLLVNGSPGAVPGVQIVARLLAQWSIYAVAAIMLLAWVRGGSKARISLVLAGMTAVLGLLMNMAIGTLWYVPRPFAVGAGHMLMDHAVDASFPSDHTTVLFSVALSLLARTASRRWGMSALVVGIGTGWARVYLGVHWPLDIAGSLLVAALSTWLIHMVLGRTVVAMASVFDRAYRRILAQLSSPVRRR
ncbi:MAG: undecaprenyl-diphosphatase [Rhodobacteraceae bacterium]|nr:undecaprenyl-diphosphatase [Paracoccaceae bacterium]